MLNNKYHTKLGSLIGLLPTGTVFTFLFLNPIFTNGGHCDTLLNKYLTGALYIVCAFICVFSSFTDSYTGNDRCRHFGVVTTKGIWPAPASDTINMDRYKLRFEDFVNGLFSLLVFSALALLDDNTVRCFYPMFATQQKILLQVLPPVIWVISSGVFLKSSDKNVRHGIGYPESSVDNVTGGDPSQRLLQE